MNEKWLIFIVYIVISCIAIIIILLPKNREISLRQNIITILLCFLWPLWAYIMIGSSIYHDIKNYKKKSSHKEFPSYGKCLAEITKKWNNDDPFSPQIQAARLMYDYLIEWYINEKI